MPQQGDRYPHRLLMIDDAVLYRLAEPLAGVRPYWVLLFEPMKDYFSACAGGLPEGLLIEWATGLITPDQSFIDIGSHVGTWSAVFAARGHNVWSFEANSQLWPLLDATAALNGLNKHWTRRRHGVGSEYAEMVLEFPNAEWIDGGGASLVCHFDNPAHNQATKVFPLDGFFVPNVGLIKIDVEGFELEVLKGAVATIGTYKPTILFECWVEDRGQQREAVWSFLENDLGYKVQETTWPEMYIATPNGTGNDVA